MKTEFLMEYTATLEEGLPVGKGPAGERIIVDITGGSFEGPKARGKILPSGADWLTVRESGFAQLDVRATFATDDGAHIYVQYYGIVEMTEAAQTALTGGGETQFGDAYFFTQLRFETGDERYAWLNDTVAIGEGRLLSVDGGPAVQYRVHRVIND